MPAYYLFALAWGEGVTEKECASEINSLLILSVLLFQDTAEYAPRERGEPVLRVPFLPLPLMFLIPRGHLLSQVTQLHPGYGRLSELQCWGRKSSFQQRSDATEKGRGEKLVIKSTFSRPSLKAAAEAAADWLSWRQMDVRREGAVSQGGRLAKLGQARKGGEEGKS